MDILTDKIDAIKPIGTLDLYKVREIMTSNKINETEKIKFLKNNQTKIEHLVNEKISGTDFEIIMENRPLKLVNPLKNEYTKLVDVKITSLALGIKPSELNHYVENVIQKLSGMEDLKSLGISGDIYKQIKTYVYRHGTKKQVIAILDYELCHTTDILKTLYRTLDYNSCGIANYFMFPHHKLDNSTLIKLYNVIDKNLELSSESGKISEVNALETAEWALAKIYDIQNNQHFQNAIKLKKELG